VTGLPLLGFTELTDDRARRQRRAEGRPEESVEVELRVWATVPETVARVTSTLEEVVGRPLRDHRPRDRRARRHLPP
jgi:hypothetical protein